MNSKKGRERGRLVSPPYLLFILFNISNIVLLLLVSTARPGLTALVPCKLDRYPGIVSGHEVAVLPRAGVRGPRGLVQVTVSILVIVMG